MSHHTRRWRDIDIVSTTNPGSNMADVVVNIQTNITAADKNFRALTGPIDGHNQVFTIEELPDEGTVHLYLGGVLQHPGSTEDYEIVDSTITYAVAPPERSIHWVNYKVTTPV